MMGGKAATNCSVEMVFASVGLTKKRFDYYAVWKIFFFQIDHQGILGYKKVTKLMISWAAMYETCITHAQ